MQEAQNTGMCRECATASKSQVRTATTPRSEDPSPQLRALSLSFLSVFCGAREVNTSGGEPEPQNGEREARSSKRRHVLCNTRFSGALRCGEPVPEPPEAFKDHLSSC